MPELPEMVIIAKQMNQTLIGKVVKDVSIFQPKCLNRPAKDYQKFLPGVQTERISSLGKWIRIDFHGGMRLLINLGMGGEIVFLKRNQNFPDKTKFALQFRDRTGFFVTLWWFGYIHLVRKDENHPMTDTLGPDPLSLTCESFIKLLENRRGEIKSFLLNQKRIRGIGNFYIQEILFRARIHPRREIGSLTQYEMKSLFKMIQTVLNESISLGSSSYELDFFGEKGQYGLNQISIGYREGGSCPICQSQIEKIRTGSTAQFICPVCQKSI
ncbi:Fpg/Nei family DNA glycosylase [bacterium]|nr:Fpg/Nei family DNA glycosylase [bacterium]